LTTIPLAGCAPATFQRALREAIVRSRVADPAARRTTSSSGLRLNAALISDLDDAIVRKDSDKMRQDAERVYRAAAELAQTVTRREIARLPLDERRKLGQEFDSADSTPALSERFDRYVAGVLEQDLRSIEQDSPTSLVRKLRALRRGVEPLPDDRGRLTRRLMLSWAALPTWIGLGMEEAKLAEKNAARIQKKFDRVAIWRPSASTSGSQLERSAPVIVVEWPEHRSYAERDDRLGAVRLAREAGALSVSIDPATPEVYAYESLAKIRGRRYPQLVYVWWFPERPEMSRNDPAAGHIDGGMLRLTFDSRGRVALAETSLNCGCGHQIFVSSDLEQAAQEAFGAPLRDKRFSVEQHVPGKHDLSVIDTFDAPSDGARPTMYLAAGYHEVCRLTFADPSADAALRLVAESAYRVAAYDALDALPVESGVGSMFGADGLVHGAGRREGFLLAPTGMLSAGQPRKRGTHRIRWDDYLFDDPRLFERTLRLPPEF